MISEEKKMEVYSLGVETGAWNFSLWSGFQDQVYREKGRGKKVPVERSEKVPWEETSSTMQYYGNQEDRGFKKPETIP